MSDRLFEWTIRVRIAATIVGDGLDLSEDEFVHAAFMRAFPLVRGSEIEVIVERKPDAEDIRREQGYVGYPAETEVRSLMTRDSFVQTMDEQEAELLGKLEAAGGEGSDELEESDLVLVPILMHHGLLSTVESVNASGGMVVVVTDAGREAISSWKKNEGKGIS